MQHLFFGDFGLVDCQIGVVDRTSPSGFLILMSFLGLVPGEFSSIDSKFLCELPLLLVVYPGVAEARQLGLQFFFSDLAVVVRVECLGSPADDFEELRHPGVQMIKT